jgi:NAD(P)-dependent dehydrogenase (short-subunit alcohol dehydrogenase family)
MTADAQDMSVATTNLKGRACIVTGAAGGVGAATAVALAANGADLFLSDRSGTDSHLADLAEAIRHRFATKVFHACAEMTQREEVSAMVAEADVRLDGIYGAVNCAGIFRHDLPVCEVSETDWNEVMRVNLDAVRFLASSVLPFMLSGKGGSFVTIASDSAFDANPGEGAYGIAKLGSIKLMAYLAREHSHSGIRFNAIAPGWIRTPMTQKILSDPEFARSALAAVPSGRISEPDEIASVVLFLVSDLASYVNGHCVIVDGGRLAGVPA